MKIVQINSVCGVGSTGRIAIDVRNVLNKHNIENYIFYGYGKSGLEKCERYSNILEVKFHIAVTRFFGYHGFASIIATKRLISRLEEIKPDIIHLHNIHGFHINIRMLFNYIKGKNLKVIWTLHDCWSFTGHCAYFDYSGCEYWKTGCRNCRNLGDYPISYFFDRSRQQFNKKKEIFTGVSDLTVVTPSEWLSNLVKQSFLKNYPVKVINNGTDLETFKPTKSDLKDKLKINGKFIVLGICFVLEDRKGGRYLIELANKLDDRFHMVILGLKTDYQLPDNITLIGKTTSTNELSEIYSMADIFINPTLEDNFPTVNLESLACGTPVITFNTGGSIEAVDEKTGIIVEKGDIDGIYNAVIKLYENNLDSDDCVNRAREKYNKFDRYNDYFELYNSETGKTE